MLFNWVLERVLINGILAISSCFLLALYLMTSIGVQSWEMGYFLVKEGIIHPLTRNRKCMLRANMYQINDKYFATHHLDASQSWMAVKTYRVLLDFYEDKTNQEKYQQESPENM